MMRNYNSVSRYSPAMKAIVYPSRVANVVVVVVTAATAVSRNRNREAE